MADVIYGAGEPAGYALIPEPTEKELRFCANKGIEVIEADSRDLLAATGAVDEALVPSVYEVGC